MNDAQRAAQEALESAVRQHVAAFRPTGDDAPAEAVSDWALVANVVSWNGNDKMSAYHMAYANGEMEEHRAIGLFALGTDVVMNGQDPEE